MTHAQMHVVSFIHVALHAVIIDCFSLQRTCFGFL